jgi:hypothetical protein
LIRREQHRDRCHQRQRQQGRSAQYALAHRSVRAADRALAASATVAWRGRPGKLGRRDLAQLLAAGVDAGGQRK